MLCDVYKYYVSGFFRGCILCGYKSACIFHLWICAACSRSTFMLAIDFSMFTSVQNGVLFSAVVCALLLCCSADKVHFITCVLCGVHITVTFLCDLEHHFCKIHSASVYLQDHTHARHLAAGTSNAVRLSRFFDKVSLTHINIFYCLPLQKLAIDI